MRKVIGRSEDMKQKTRKLNPGLRLNVRVMYREKSERVKIPRSEGKIHTLHHPKRTDLGAELSSLMNIINCSIVGCLHNSVASVSMSYMGVEGKVERREPMQYP